MSDDEREGVAVRGALVDEMDVEPVNLRREVIEPVQQGFPSAPVVAVGPIARQLAGVVQRDALAPVVDALTLCPSGARQSLLQVVEVVVGDCNAERGDGSHGPFDRIGALDCYGPLQCDIWTRTISWSVRAPWEWRSLTRWCPRQMRASSWSTAAISPAAIGLRPIRSSACTSRRRSTASTPAIWAAAPSTRSDGTKVFSSSPAGTRCAPTTTR